MKIIIQIWGTLFIALVLSAITSPAQPTPPLVPTAAPGKLLDIWPFSGTNFLSLRGSAPTSLTNVSLVPTWDGNGLQVDSTNAAWINYAVVEPDGQTNLSLTQGTISTWISLDLDSGDDLGAWGTILEVGAWNTNLATGAFGLYLSRDISTLSFSAQSNGVSTNYLNAPISWNAGDWHHLAITYSATNSALYLEGQFVTNGPGITVIPDASVISNGFSIGSDGFGTGLLQARAVFNDLEIYSYELSAQTISNDYADDSENVYPLSSSGFHTDTGPPGPPGGGVGTNGGGGGSFASPVYDTNAFYLEALQFGTNIYNTDSNSLTLLLHNTIADIAYQIWSTTNLQGSNTIWVVEQNVIGSEITNFTPATVPLTGAPQKYFKAMAYTLDSDGDGLPDWWENLYGLDPNNPDTGNTGIPDGYKQDSAGDGYNNLQKYQMGIPPETWVTPQAPSGFSAVINTNGTSATLTWNASPGSVSNYTILVQDDQSGLGFVTLTNVSGSLVTFTDSSSTFSDGIQYQIQANYAGGSSAVSGQWDPTISPSLSANAKLVRGPYGRWQLAFSAISPGITSINILWQDLYFGDGSSDGIIASQTISVGDLVNGCYVIPDDTITNYLGNNSTFYPDEYNLGYIAWVQGVGTNGVPGPQTQAGIVPSDAPYFMDCRQHLQESMTFLMEATGINNPYIFVSGDGRYVSFTNFVEMSFIHPDGTYQFESGTSQPFIATDDTWPLAVDYGFSTLLYTTNPAPSYTWVPDFTTPPAVLTAGGAYQNGPYWIAQVTGFSSGGSFDYPTNLTDDGATIASGFSSVSLAGGFENIYGLPVESAMVVSRFISLETGLASIPQTNVISPGTSAGFEPDGSTNVYNFEYYSQFQTPKLHTVDYYFAPVLSPGTSVIGNTPTQIYPLPLTADFAVTNQTPLTIGAVGQPMLIGGWAKQAITNTASGKFAYLGQYFQTNAYLMSNGVVTTNTAGILSPYGEFFPTEPGQVALITMPDLTTGQTGTDIVNVIKLQLDVNHDGTMDTTFAGPDNTSANQPFVFWINNDNDVCSNPLTDPGHDINDPNSKDSDQQYINSQRDLEDYARLWIMGVPTLPSSGGYEVKLNWNVISGSPSINLVNAVETNGGFGYLTNSTTAAAQLTSSPSLFGPSYKFARIDTSETYFFPNNYFTNNSTKCFLFEGSGVGKGELVLTIAQNGTNIATTSAFFDLHDIKDFYERAAISDITNSSISNWTSSFTVNNTLQPSATDDTNLIVLIHGINVGDWDAANDGETVYKRLYWSGYQGRFATVKWPCEFLDSSALLSVDTEVFNRSEIKAYKASTALNSYLTQLRTRFAGYQLNLLTHSQGNAVVSEAILNGAPFDTYILTQGAIPDSAYDFNAPTNSGLMDAETELGPTPEFKPMGYQGVYTNLSGRIVNFYNPFDPVLAVWQVDQELAKPNVITSDYNFDGTNGYRQISATNRYIVTDSQESRAFVSRSRTLSIGQSGPASAHGVIQSAVDLNAQYGFNNAFPGDHSAQWVRPIQTSRPYFQQVLRSCQIIPAP